jgi:hypothetical protein
MTKRWTTFLAGCGALAILCLPAVPARAQDQTPADATPKPAARAYPPLGDTTSDEQPSPDQLLPDSRPLTGVQNQTLGQVESPHSYWEPGFQYSNTIQNSLPGEASSGWSSTNYLAATMSLLEQWRASQLAVNYSGGGTFSTDPTLGNGYFHQLGVTQAFQWARWQVQFLDQFSYTPDSEFGFGGGTSLGIPGGGIAPSAPQTGLTGNYQTLFTTEGPRYSNNFTTQVVYQISPRTSVNASGSYGILRFENPGSINNDTAEANVGYNYQLNKEDTIGLEYAFSRYSYIGNSQAIDDHVISVAYGKKITGRLALKLFGGPDITLFKVPVGNVSRRTSGSGGGNITYRFSHVDTGVSYNHGVTGGSGAFAGSETDSITGNVSRQLTRIWQGQVNFGFARNRDIVSGAAEAGFATAFNSYFAGGGLSRQIGPNANLSFAYTARIQTGGQVSGCTLPGCSGSYTQHQVILNLQWHTRPLALR